MTDSTPPPPTDARVVLVPATVHGRCLVRPPAHGAPRGWLLGFHGYAQSAELFLPMLERIPAARDWLVVAVQALHPFYTRGNHVVANWMTRQDREHAIADNIAYVDAVGDALEREHGPAPRIVCAGFSQGVAMAYRAAVAGRRRAAAIVAAGGDLPPELRERPGIAWPRVLACTGRSDDWFTPARLEAEAAWLREHGADVRAVAFDGGHEWGDAVVAEADRLLGELGGAAEAG